MIFLTGSGCGLFKYLDLKHRSDLLLLITRFCEQLAEQIRYTAAPLDELLQTVASAPEFSSFGLSRVGTEDPRSVLASGANNPGFSMGDRRLFEEFAAGFGRADLEGEIQRCRQYAALFEERYRAAREDIRRRGRLYVTLGLCGGSALALVLG